MFIFWGKKIVSKYIGFVADFCPICRGPQGFKLFRVGVASHVYGLSFGSGKLLEHKIECCECGAMFITDPLKYKSHSKQQGHISELINRTFPNLRAVYKERFALEDKIRTNPSSLTPEERREQLLEPFLLVSPKVEQRYSRTHIDKETSLVFLSTVILTIFISKYTESIFGLDPVIVGLSICGVGLVLSVYQLIISGRRYLRKKIIPIVAKGLTPIKPSQEELKVTLAQLKELGHKVGKKLKLSDLQVALGRPIQNFS